MADEDEVLLLQRLGLNHLLAQLRNAEPKSDASCVKNSCNGAMVEGE
jgi:hypothetical protein